jgi:hypothetical protein
MLQKKTTKACGFMGLHTELGGILPQCDLEHVRTVDSEQWAVNREQRVNERMSEEVKK